MRLKLFAFVLGAVLPIMALAPAPVQAQDSEAAGDPTEAAAEAMGGIDDALGAASGGLDDVFDTIGGISGDNLSDGITPPFNAGAGGFAGIGNIGNIGNIFGGVSDFLGSLPGVASEFLEAFLGDFGVPDLQQVDIAIEEENGSNGEGSQATALAQALESPAGGNPESNRYSVGRDQSHEAQRNTAVGVAQASALTEDAQGQMAERAERAQATLEGSQAAAESSAQSDVSQDILRNLSEQSSQAAELSAQQLAEAQQARTDRAIGNMLAAQQARALDMQHTRERRERIASGNRATTQIGSLFMPGGFSLGSDGEQDSAANGNPDTPRQ